MNKVYIVIESSYYDNGFNIIGTFDSREKAGNYCKSIQTTWKKGEWKKIRDDYWKNDDYEWNVEIVEQEVI